LHSQPLPNPASQIPANQAPPVVSPAPDLGGTADPGDEVSPPEKQSKPPEQPVDSDVMKE